MTTNETKAQHTPGPWNVSEHSWCETSITAPSTSNSICLLDINHATEESEESDAAVMAANARLIAAAPDLLTCLQDALASFADSVEGGEADEWVKVSRAAISKSIGSAS